MDINEEEYSQKKTHENKLAITIIPFNYRKSPLLSITFHSFDLEMGQFRIKIESDGESNLETPILSKFCETTIVRINYILYYIK